MKRIWSSCWVRANIDAKFMAWGLLGFFSIRSAGTPGRYRSSGMNLFSRTGILPVIFFV